MQFFLEHKTVIIRTLGSLMLLIGFAAHFWTVPKEGYSESEIAAMNVARMEAKVKGTPPPSGASAKKDDSKFLEEFKNTREKQLQYLTIISMILGVGFLAYSFIKKD